MIEIQRGREWTLWRGPHECGVDLDGVEQLAAPRTDVADLRDYVKRYAEPGDGITEAWPGGRQWIVSARGGWQRWQP